MAFISGIVLEVKEPPRCKQCGFVAGQTHWEPGTEDCHCCRCTSIRANGFCGGGCERMYQEEKERVLDRARRTA